MFWDKLIKNRKFNLNNFRNTKKHNIFANWSPYERGLTFHNYLIYNFLKTIPKLKLSKILKKLGNTELGNPPGITYNNKKVTFDDCWTIEELIFLNNKIKKNSNILEIGAGYGRSAQGILNNFEIRNYYIIDLKLTLKLSKKYLKKVLSKKNFEKITFFSFEDFNFDKNKIFQKEFKTFDLTINIDSLGEMPPPLIRKYLNFFKKFSKSFYSKNSIAKYRPKDLINHLNPSKKPPSYNLKLNLQKEIINIFDDREIKRCTKKAIINFNPDQNQFYFISKNSELINYYCHIFYYKK